MHHMAPPPLSPVSENAHPFFESNPRKRFRMPSYSTGSTNVTMQEHTVGRDQRADVIGRHEGFRGCTIWFTGLSGAGKTTVSFALEKALTQMGIPCYGLDGDNVRHGLCKNLGFSKDDRAENIRRVAEVAKLFADAGMVTLASFISPFRVDRDSAREIHKTSGLPFFEVYVDAPLEVCESRDPKDLYKKARKGQVQGMTGIDSAYEPPVAADLVLHSGKDSAEECVNNVLEFLVREGVVPMKALSSLAPLVRQLIVSPSIRSTLEEELRGIEYEVELDLVELQWLQVLAEGWASPLYGFMRERQYLQALHFGQMLDLKRKCIFPGEEEVEDEEGEDSFPMDGPLNQSVPIVLTITSQEKEQVMRNGHTVPAIALSYEGKRIAILRKGEIFEHRRKERAARQFGSIDERHPGVAQVMNSGEFCLGGDIEVVDRISFNDGLDKFRFTPMELRRILAEKKADAIFVFQLRNPIHNGHALLMRETRAKLLETYRNPILLLHPLGGWTKDDDVPLKVRIRQHEAVIDEGLLGAEWTVLSIFPSPMMYAGPTEVQWHARARLAAGVHTYIVGRDPAGIADPASESGDALYEVTHGAKVLSMAPGLSHLNVVPFRVAAYDKKVGQMAMFDPSRKEDFDFISGTKMRGLARNGQTPPDGFMAPKAWEILAAHYREIANQ
ncbi:pps-1 [Pristionchus pacificus]|uniref:3'-phosphoadenosine-5'-phosphosulfate synthase n=1 Tax=Pristionchus pacificus TaxID=54126 RepID=A0A454XUA3_PRIPA|nr:pps-1 [Pristionchus pacificus]|eukprot:PDM75200.1 pps-1 [Pristionchus pacificus]